VNDKPRGSGAIPRPRASSPVSGTRAEYEPTLTDVSAQIGALSAQVSGVHSSNAQLAKRIENVRSDVNDRFTVFHKELVLLRQTQVIDHAPRIKAVEQKTHTVPPAAKAVGKYSAVALAIPFLLQILAAIKPNLAGPIEQVIKFFQ
jgi:hypothetical protein